MYAAVPCYRLGKLHKLIRHDLPPSPRGLPAAPAMTGRPL
jgi:fatty acid desaturase